MVTAVHLRPVALGAVLVLAGSACAAGSRGAKDPTAIASTERTTTSTANAAPSSPSTVTSLEPSATTARATPPTTRARTAPATSATTRATAPAPTTTATVTSTSGPAAAASPPPAGRNEVPRAVVTDVSSGVDVDLRTLIPADRPILFWFYSPY